MRNPKPKEFRYKKVKKPSSFPSVKVDAPSTEELQYTGYVDNGYGELKTASQGEENCFKAAYGTGKIIGHRFRMPVGAPEGMPGWKELDYLFELKTGAFFAMQVRDYDFIHAGKAMEGKDASSDMYILEKLQEDEGIIPLMNRIHSVSDDDLATPEKAKETMELLLP